MNWYKCKKRKIILAELTGEQGKFIEMQELLAEVVKGSPFENNSYHVGGSVRDELMGKVPDDIDMVVEAPNGGELLIEYIAKTLNLPDKPVVSGEFFTASVFVKNDIEYFIDKLHSSETRKYHVSGIKIEAVQSRKERYSGDGFKPSEVEYAPLTVDTKRRDLTVNTLLKKVSSGPSYGSTPEEISRSAWEKAKSGEIRDILSEATNGAKSGLDDIKNGTINTPDDPDVIYDDDATRMIRAIRFAAKYHDLGWKMTDEIRDGIKRNINLLEEKKIPKEQITKEFLKMLSYGKAYESILLMDELGMLEKVFPELKSLQGVAQSPDHHSEGDAFEHTMLAIKNLQENHPDSDAATYLAVIAHDWGKAVTQNFEENGKITFYQHEDESANLVDERLKSMKGMPTSVREKTVKLVKNHMRFNQVKTWNKKTFIKFMREIGDDWDDLLAVMSSDERAAVPESGEKEYKYDYVKEQTKNLRDIQPPPKSVFNGGEIMSMFNIQNGGPMVGQIMKIADDILLSNLEWMKLDDKTRKENVKNALMSDPRLQDIIGDNNDVV